MDIAGLQKYGMTRNSKFKVGRRIKIVPLCKFVF